VWSRLGFQFAVPVPASICGYARTAGARIDDDRRPTGSSYFVKFGSTDLFERTELRNGQRLVGAGGVITHAMFSPVHGRFHMSCSGNRGEAAGKNFYLVTFCPGADQGQPIAWWFSTYASAIFMAGSENRSPNSPPPPASSAASQNCYCLQIQAQSKRLQQNAHIPRVPSKKTEGFFTNQVDYIND